MQIVIRGVLAVHDFFLQPEGTKPMSRLHTAKSGKSFTSKRLQPPRPSRRRSVAVVNWDEICRQWRAEPQPPRRSGRTMAAGGQSHMDWHDIVQALADGAAADRQQYVKDPAQEPWLRPLGKREFRAWQLGARIALPPGIAPPTIYAVVRNTPDKSSLIGWIRRDVFTVTKAFWDGLVRNAAAGRCRDAWWNSTLGRYSTGAVVSSDLIRGVPDDDTGQSAPDDTGWGPVRGPSAGSGGAQ
jgi:hypothetical protein